ncbi:MAG: autoantigen p27 domain-containing protein [Methanoregula sp.]|nr:autoantigen p27 domain-containing protein [Methanoregula sp.]
MQKYCPECGIPLYFENQAVCPNCGVRLRPLLIRGVIRNPYLAVMLSFFFVGWGQWYNGKTWAGLKFFGAFLGSCLLIVYYTIMEASQPVSARFVLILVIVLATGIWVYGMYDAYKTADRINRNKESFFKKSQLFWIPVVVLILSVVAVISVFVFHMDVYFQPAKVVTATATRQGDNIIIAYQGGSGHTFVSKLNYGIGITDHEWNSPKVGEKVVLYGDMLGKDHIIVSVVFVDGSERVILDTYV